VISESPRSLVASGGTAAGSSPYPSNDNETTIPDPTRPGPFGVCVSGPNIYMTYKQAQFPSPIEIDVRAVAYIPVVAKSCDRPIRNSPLVVLFHARHLTDVDTDYLKYPELCEHLASYGYVVVSVDHHDGDMAADFSMFTVQIFKGLLSYIQNGGFGLSGVVNNQLTVIGHSYGGRRANVAAQNVPPGWELRCVVFMAPSTPSWELSTLMATSSLLAVQVRTDSDPTTNGGPPSQGKPTTAVSVYEVAGRIDGKKNDFLFPKHLLYVRGNRDGSSNILHHFFQHELFLRTYILAYLQAHVKGFMEYFKYFKRQAIVPSLEKTNPSIVVGNMHEDKTRKTLVDWGTPQKWEQSGTVSFSIGALPEIDGLSYVLNNATVGRLVYPRNNANVTITVTFDPPQSGVEWEFLVVSLCQSYDQSMKKSPTGGAVYPTVSIRSGAVWSSPVSLAKLSHRAVLYPDRYIDFKYKIDFTHNCLDEFMVPLSALSSKGIDLGQISGIRFDFSDTDGSALDAYAVVLVGPIKLLSGIP